MKTEHRIKILIVVAILVMIATAVVPFKMSSKESLLQKALLESETRISTIQETFSLMKDAETGQRGFIITGQEGFLEPYNKARARLEDQAAQRRLARPRYSDEQAAHFEGLLDRKLSDLATSIEVRRSEGAAAAHALVSTGRGKHYMDDIRAEVDKIRADERRFRDDLRTEAERYATNATYATAAVTALNILLVAIALYFLLRLLKRQRQAADELLSLSADLQGSVRELGRRNEEMSLMAQMARALDASVSMDESLRSLAVFSEKLLPGTSGQLYLYRNSRNLLEKAAQWGAPQDVREVLEPHDCWGLRLGRLHHAETTHDLCCTHYSKDNSSAATLCLPLSAQGEVIGLLALEPMSKNGEPGAVFERGHIELATALGEQLALALSNAKLKEVLKRQSIVDPLTGLFNRRYMDETLLRELSRAKRKGCPLSFVMIDVDHFKSINDRLGHEAGDAVLRTIASQLKKNVREGDLVCRFGGEEIVILLPECDQQDALVRAEKLRHAISTLDLSHTGKAIGPITASFGVASYPTSASSVESLIGAADRAMYQAKSSGRNQVIAADVQYSERQHAA
jgi:diguanylate cyclase (GGDEF)-like protein